MHHVTSGDKSLVISYLTLRKIVGILGFSFPFVLFIGAYSFFDTGIQSSISSYYYTGMRDVFVGTLCVIGFFLLSYRGHDRRDDIAGDLACVFAIGIALFPTAPEGSLSLAARIVDYLHLIFSAAFFITLIYFSLFLFTKTKSASGPTALSKQRIRIYRICGYTMSVCILLIGTYRFLPATVIAFLENYNPIYWLEGIAVVAFGTSWLTKGHILLKNRPAITN